MENIKRTYPIKYAIMPIYDRGLDGLEWKVVANIVSKCYVISEKKLYLSYSDYKIIYEVVFPYLKGSNEIKKYPSRLIPEFDKYLKCTNSINVDQLFDSYEETLIASEQSNVEIIYHLISSLPLDGNFKHKVEIIEEGYQELFDRYKKFENYIQNKTVDMEVTKSYSLNLEKIVEKLFDDPKEFYIKLTNILSANEKEYLKKLIKNKRCSNCTNESCSNENCKKIELDAFGKLNGSGCLNWNNPELVGKKLLKKII